jgi:di/tricarboxylate transporter
MEQQAVSQEILLTLGIASAAMFLFVWNRIRADMVAIVVMAILILTGLVSPAEGTSGFANEATLTVALMMVLAAGLARTGAIDILGALVGRLAGASEVRFIAVLLCITVPASAFVNNTPVVIVLLPLVLGFARQHGIAASRLLMPLSYGAQLGGTLTLIGTSTNLLVASLIVDMGLPRFNLLDITPAALPLALIGVAYLLTVGRWLAPSRASEASLVARYELRDYLTAVTVEEGAPVAGRTLAQSNFGRRHGLNIVAITRGEDRIALPGGLTRIEPGDLLLVEGKVRNIANLEKTAGLRIAGAKPELLESGVEPDFAEVLVPPRSRVIGRSVRDLGFRVRYGLAVLALRRHAESVHEALGAIPLEPGDILLTYGPPDALNALHRSGDMVLLGSLELPARRLEKLRFSASIVLIVILLAAFNVTSILIAALLGAIAMTLTGCLRPDEAYRDMDWMVLVLLAAIIPLGVAMQNTGAATFLAGHIMILTEPLGPYGTLAAFYLFTSLLTEIMSNNAAAVMLTPVAVAVATALHVSPIPFVVATMFAASNAFMTPIGYQTNTFIFGPGGFTFADFVRVGGPLNLLLLAAATFVIPLVFPF